MRLPKLNVADIGKKLHKPEILALAGILLAALALRLWGIKFGLPYRYHIDETFYVAGALKMASGFDLPIITHGPNLFYMVLLGEYGVYYIIARLLGMVNSVAAFEQLYRSDPTVFVVLARLTSAISGVLTLLPTYLIGKKLHRKAVGAGAAIILAFTFQHIRESHYGTPDVFVGLLVTCCLLFCLRIINQGLTRDYVACAFWAGLATGTKFTSILLLIPIGIAHSITIWNTSEHKIDKTIRKLISKQSIAAALTFGIAFAIAYPNVILRPAAFWEYIRFLIDVGEAGFITQFQIDAAPASIYYLRSLMTWGLGWILFLATVIGVLSILKKRNAESMVMLGFIVCYFIFLARSPYYASRYLVPLLPILSVCAALGVIFLVNNALLRLPTKNNRLIYALMFICVLIQPLITTFRHNDLLNQTDTRTIAKAWIEQNIPAGTKIALDWQKHAPPLRSMQDDYPPNDIPYDLMIADGIGLPRYTLSEYKEANASYLIQSSFIDDLALASAADREAKASFQKALTENCELVYEIRPYITANKPPFVFDQIFGPVTTLWQFERPGPELKIYRLTP